MMVEMGMSDEESIARGTVGGLRVKGKKRKMKEKRKTHGKWKGKRVESWKRKPRPHTQRRREGHPWVIG
jgi:hypothetical protein